MKKHIVLLSLLITLTGCLGTGRYSASATMSFISKATSEQKIERKKIRTEISSQIYNNVSYSQLKEVILKTLSAIDAESEDWRIKNSGLDVHAYRKGFRSWGVGLRTGELYKFYITKINERSYRVKLLINYKQKANYIFITPPSEVKEEDLNSSISGGKYVYNYNDYNLLHYQIKYFLNKESKWIDCMSYDTSVSIYSPKDLFPLSCLGNYAIGKTFTQPTEK